MTNYLIVKIVFSEEHLCDVWDLKIDEHHEIAQKIECFADEHGAVALFESVANEMDIGRSFASIEHNFYLSDEEKRQLVGYIYGFFEGSYIDGDTMEVYPTLRAVRFLQTNGEIFEI